MRFTLGSFKRGEQTSIQVAERLILDLVDADGNIRRQLTFPGGARELMPAEYAYTLPRGSLPAGRYAFRVRAWAPRQEEPTSAARDVPAVRTVTLYSRPGCHLCDEAREALERVRRRRRSSLDEVDIERDDALHARYLERIPVVALDGEELFDYFVDEAALLRRILYREGE